MIFSIIITFLLFVIIVVSLFTVVTLLEILDEARIIKRQIREVLTKELLADLNKIAELEEEEENI